MLKKVAVSDLRVGMYIHELCGSWIDHSFWRSRFLIQKESDLQRLTRSRLQWVWIDTKRGVDVDVRAVTLGPFTRPPAGSATARAAQAVALSHEQEAFANAHDICEVARDRVTQMFADARLGNRIDLGQVERLVQDMAESVEEHPDALTSLARIKRADQYTYMHSVAVAALMTSLSRAMGLPDDQVRLAGMAGLLHDIGKVNISDAILNKPGRLLPDEYAQIQKHPELGEALLREDADIPPEVLDVCRHHHERIDGQGYPDRLPADRIAQLVRMASICDVYDAVTSNRPYKKGWDPAFAIHKMLHWDGQFDPDILQAFIRAVGRYPVGSIISLTQSELGLVVAQNCEVPELPVVKVFYSIRWSHAIPERRVDLAEAGSPSQVLPVAFPVDWAQSGLPVPPVVG
ncbi:MAG: HD-GYP domain-containing protein [Castellaniella sp.]|uniref:HD-GYP domain-containing protein n=1 Tax=Castellaniella sp. TaxID=1955812 RepID=UPI0012097DB0|nr:HD-GYP domain-containing protein [Castellaniella sp.]TAN28259.1 MAG: HD-GYP domain-containing protein [Castellaniella sp.]